MEAVRWGMIGCGDVTEVKSGPGFQKAQRSSLVAVMRRTGSLARDYAQRHNVPRWYTDAEALIHDPDVDAIYIATPPSSHKPYTLLAARAGKPVYVEKPMALNFEECQAMNEACRKARVPLFVAYYRRALQRFLKIKELIGTGAIGEVRFVTVTLWQPPTPEELNPDTLPWRVLPDIAGGGRFVDLASHMLDFLDFALGPIQTAYGIAACQARRYPAEDIVTASWRFASGALGMGTWCFTTSESNDWTEIVGTEGKLGYSTFDARPVTLTTIQGRQEVAIGYPEHIQQALIQSVVDELTGHGRCPSTGETAARTSWVMDRMLKACTAGGT